jgi:hypothetical protein
MAMATRAVLVPGIPGRVVVSTQVNYVVDEHAAAALSEELGAAVITREAAFTCARDPQTQKIDTRTCRVDGGQLVEVRAVEACRSIDTGAPPAGR